MTTIEAQAQASGGSRLLSSRRPYVPILQDRSGELAALSHMPESDWLAIKPLMVVVGPRTGRITRGATASRARKLSAVLVERPFFVDLLRVSPRQNLDGANLIGYLLDRLRGRGAKAIPVAHLGDPVASLQAMRASVQIDGRGAALRVRLDKILPSGETSKSLGSSVVERLGLTDREVDLILDLAYLPPDTAVDTAAVGELVGDWATAARWRSATLAGTSMPKTLTMVTEGSIGGLPRREWTTWQAIRARGYDVNYGDYAIQHPEPPNETGPGMRANIRYTLSNRTVVARGVGPVTQGVGSAAYIELSRLIWELPDFSTKDFSWGDVVIERCAQGLIPRSGQHLWRGVGTSHHMRLVLADLGLWHG